VSSRTRTAVYSTVHEGVLPYAAEWAASVSRQTDMDFDLWLAVDGVSDQRLAEVTPTGIEVHVQRPPNGATPATIRSDAFATLAAEYDCVVLVDADDVLDESRVAAAVSDLETHDVSACALRLIDSAGWDLGRDFGRIQTDGEFDPGKVLPRWNVVGGSNSAYRSSALKACLPLPEELQIVDWYVAMAAWASGARFRLDSTARMQYRQHSDNMAKVVPPFTAGGVRSATQLVLRHYSTVLRCMTALRGDARAAVASARGDVSLFADNLLGDQRALEDYVQALNKLSPPQMWWTIVANPDLETLWRP